MEVLEKYSNSNSRRFAPELNAGSFETLLDDDDSLSSFTSVAHVLKQI